MESGKKRSAPEGHLNQGGKVRKLNEEGKSVAAETAAVPTEAVASAIHKRRSTKRRTKEVFKFPVEPRVIVTIKKPRTVMNHSYRDFSIVPPELDYEHPTSIDDMTFSQKVHDILSTKDFQLYVNWMPHGRSFRVHVPKIFEEKICKVYFGHSRYSSFLRLLNNYGFKHITQGPDRNCYYHECFLRGLPHLCKYMPQPRNARRLIPDPENEPDFYKLAKLFPLPDVQGDEASDASEAPRPPAAAAAAAASANNDNEEPSKPPASISDKAVAAGVQGNNLTAASVQGGPNLVAAALHNPNVNAAARAASVLAAQNEQQTQRAAVAARGLQTASLLQNPALFGVVPSGLGRGLSSYGVPRTSTLDLANELLTRQQLAAALEQNALVNAVMGLGAGRGLVGRGLGSNNFMGRGFPF